jgi:hypothetical protein
MSALTWSPHPVLKVPTRAQCLAQGPAWTQQVWQQREQLIANERQDPFRHGYRPQVWADACELLKGAVCLIILGGNGASKTFFEADLGVRTMIENTDSMALWLHESEKSSIRIQQSAVHRYLPQELRPTDDNKIKRGVTTKLAYKKASGFSDQSFVMPNGSMAVFGSYQQDIESYEGDGWKIVLADENLPLAWLNTLQYRLPRRGGKLVWGFTPIRGITPAIKHVVQGAVTIKSQPAELLPANHRVSQRQDWPEGHMPYIQRSVLPKTFIMYWPTSANPWSGYEAFKLLMQTKPVEEIERRAYGFARNTATTLLNLSAEHIKEHETIPQDLTTYMVLDPALARNSFVTWEGVDRDGRRYTIDEWPDVETYGEWAIPSEQPNRFNGDIGPAQPRLGWGIVEYKRMILTKEGARWDEQKKVWDYTNWREPERRYIDPRAGAAEHLAEEEGDSSIIHRFAEEQFDRDGVLIGPAMDLEPAMGKDEREGIEAITDLLAYNESQPIARYLNEPRKYISARCTQTIWALQNYSKRPGVAGRDEACKDPVDNASVTSRLKISSTSPRATVGQTDPRSYGHRAGGLLPIRVRASAPLPKPLTPNSHP